jgi:hypothetical protein
LFEKKSFFQRIPRKYYETAIFSLLLILALLFIIPKLLEKPGKEFLADEEVSKAIAIMPGFQFYRQP